MKAYGIKIRNCAGTTIYVIAGKHGSREAAFEAAKKGFRWFAKCPDMTQIVELIGG